MEKSSSFWIGMGSMWTLSTGKGCGVEVRSLEWHSDTLVRGSGPQFPHLQFLNNNRNHLVELVWRLSESIHVQCSGKGLAHSEHSAYMCISYHDSVEDDLTKRGQMFSSACAGSIRNYEGWIKATKSELEIICRISRFAKCQDQKRNKKLLVDTAKIQHYTDLQCPESLECSVYTINVAPIS